MSSIASEFSAAPSRRMTKEEKRVIAAASLGTIFEWYDFFLYGSLSAAIVLNTRRARQTRSAQARIAESVKYKLDDSDLPAALDRHP